MKIAISIVNYRTPHHVVSCIKSIDRMKVALNSTLEIDIWVVDNYSSNKCTAELKKQLGSTSYVHMIFLNSNLGFAAGHNAALTAAFATSKYNYVWILNSDCQLTNGALEAHIHAAETFPAIDIWGSTIVSTKTNQIECAGGCKYNPWLTTFSANSSGLPLAELHNINPRSLDYICGASMFIRASLFCNVPTTIHDERRIFLNEEYFLYFEELDLIKRLSSKEKVAWCKGAVIKHVGGLSTGTSGDKQNAVSEYHSTLSALKFTYFHHREKLWLVVIVRPLLKSIQHLIKLRPALLLVTIKAVRTFSRWYFSRKDL